MAPEANHPRQAALSCRDGLQRPAPGAAPTPTGWSRATALPAFHHRGFAATDITAALAS